MLLFSPFNIFPRGRFSVTEKSVDYDDGVVSKNTMPQDTDITTPNTRPRYTTKQMKIPHKQKIITTPTTTPKSNECKYIV